MLTRKQAALHKRTTRREIDRDLRRKARETLAALRQGLREAYAHKKIRLKDLAEGCRTERLAVRDRVRAMRQHALQELREAVRRERAEALKVRLERREEAKKTSATEIEKARALLAAEKAYQVDLRRIERANRARHAAHVRKVSRTERRGESDDEVRQNIPPELIVLFERVKRAIKASPRQSRTEAFLQYAEQHPHELFEILERKAAARIREMERQHREHERQMRARPRKARPRYTPEELAAVPF